MNNSRVAAVTGKMVQHFIRKLKQPDKPQVLLQLEALLTQSELCTVQSFVDPSTACTYMWHVCIVQRDHRPAQSVSTCWQRPDIFVITATQKLVKKHIPPLAGSSFLTSETLV
jgi:hypothetical protein